MSCGSDDWSVDSDYTFQDDALNEGSRSTSRAEPSDQRTGQATLVDTDTAIDSSPRQRASPEETCQADSLRPDLRGERYGLLSHTRDPFANENKGMPRSQTNLQNHGQSRSMVARQHPGYPGSSTESMHILRVEQRMFLKVRPTHPVPSDASKYGV